MNLKNKNLFTWITLALIILMPFYVFLKVLFEHQFQIPYFWVLLKEGLIVLLTIALVYEFYKARKKPCFELLDYLIFAYFGYGIAITLFNGLWLSALFHGGRYDFMFFWVFLILRHGAWFLKISLAQAIRLFVWSGWIALLIGLILKVIGEEFLTVFGYDFYRWSWVYQWAVPIYHGVESSWIRRFQGLLDGPNQMAFFLFTYMAAAFYFIKNKFEFHHGCVAIGLFVLLILTFSRSALLGLVAGVALLVLLQAKTLFIKYKKQIWAGLVCVAIVFALLLSLFEQKINYIVVRQGSTQGHFERMEIGFDRFLEKPWGHGLATSWPWYRHTNPGPITKQEEKQFIPESWFVQQLVEWWVIFFLLFCSILLLILKGVYHRSMSFFIACVWIGVMNIFLHIFEATYMSALLFLFLGLLLAKKYA